MVTLVLLILEVRPTSLTFLEESVTRNIHSRAESIGVVKNFESYAFISLSKACRSKLPDWLVDIHGFSVVVAMAPAALVKYVSCFFFIFFLGGGGGGFSVASNVQWWIDDCQFPLCLAQAVTGLRVTSR